MNKTNRNASSTFYGFEYQIIIASIYETKIIKFNKIDLNDGLLSECFLLN